MSSEIMTFNVDKVTLGPIRKVEPSEENGLDVPSYSQTMTIRDECNNAGVYSWLKVTMFSETRENLMVRCNGQGSNRLADHR